MLWLGAALVVVVLDLGTKGALFAGPAAPEWPGRGAELLPHLIITSSLHVFQPTEVAAALLGLPSGIWLAVVGALCFRYHRRTLDRAWLLAAGMLVGADLGNSSDLLRFGGVRNVFVISGPARYLCWMCGVKYESYNWTPADLFISWSTAIGFGAFLLSFLVSRRPVLGEHDAHERRA